MATSSGWFIFMAALSAACWFLGWRFAQGPRATWISGLALTLSLLGIWAWLQHNPAFAVQVIPIAILSQVEGIAAVPPFMFVVGLAWRRSEVPRQRRVVLLATIMGSVYFLQGGLWMVQTTPAVGFATTIPTQKSRQSQEYSCVPAACAAALTRIGIPTSEAEMAILTATRPGTGSTLIRGLHGLRQRIGRLPVTAELLEPTYDELPGLPMPLVAPLRFESTRQHMVLLTGRDPYGIMVLDPQVGPTYFLREDFEKVFTGKVIVLRRVGR